MGKIVSEVVRSPNLKAIAPLLREAGIELSGPINWATLEQKLAGSQLTSGKRKMIRHELARANLLK
jgi:hypothetical protein